MTTNDKNIDYYMELSYTTVLRRDPDGDVVARIQELPGCSTHGKNNQDALENLKEAQRLWIEDCLDAGDPVPEPEKDDSLPSGKWVQRVPRSLHKQLQQHAKSQGVSLNQLVTSLLSESITSRTWEAVAEQALCKFLSPEAIDARHAWGIHAMPLGAATQVYYSFNRGPVNVQSLATVESLFPKKFKVEDAFEAKTTQPRFVQR